MLLCHGSLVVTLCNLNTNDLRTFMCYARKAFDMASRCTKPDCDCAVTIVDDNGATDPTETRVETYECARGHRFTTTLEAAHS